jgi:5-aminolevulinate synthase
VFQYESFFEEQIQKKKLDHSYRIFKKVNRSAMDFPAARYSSANVRQRPISVLKKMPQLHG